MSPASFPMSLRRAGKVPWVPWRPPYAILAIAYGNRRPATKKAAPPTVSWQSNLLPPARSTFLRYGAPQAGRCLKTFVMVAATEVSSAHHEEVGGIWHPPRADPVPTDPNLAADARRRLSLIVNGEKDFTLEALDQDSNGSRGVT
jgi:hypothetical protein